MAGIHIPLEIIRKQAEDAIKNPARSLPSYVELCKITEVDVANKTVAAYFLESKMFRYNVPYCYPTYGQGCGIITVPMVGSLGVAIWDSTKLPIIIGYTAPLTSNEFNQVTRNLPTMGALNIPDLLEGEILLMSSGRSFMRFDKVGGVMLSSALFASIYLDENGNCITELENNYMRVNGVSEEVYTHNFTPVMKVIKGKHTYSYTQQPEDSVELCYRVSVEGPFGDMGFIGIDTSGKFHVCGDIIVHPWIDPMSRIPQEEEDDAPV